MKMSQISPQSLYILDDDQHYATLLKQMAEKCGWQVISEQSAWRFLEFNLPSSMVLVLDLVMPELDGIEVIRELIKRRINLTLILISGVDKRTLHSAQLLAQAYSINVTACFSKPVRLKEFCEILNTIREVQVSSKGAEEDPVFSKEDLKAGIEKQQFTIYYQPQICLKTNMLIGVEALVRWHHPKHGLVHPGYFISMAEKEGLISLLTNQVVSMVAQDNAMLNTIFGKDIMISINISANDIISLSLPDQLNHLLSEYSIDPKNITFEITESAVMTNLVSFLDVLNRLSLKGFSLSIDDFGTGFSSLSLLYQAPFSELKIDQSFVGRMLHDAEAMIIVEICVLLAKKMGMKIVAEGIEDEKTLSTLKTLGCDVGQGYFIGKPMPVKDIVIWKNQRSTDL